MSFDVSDPMSRHLISFSLIVYGLSVFASDPWMFPICSVAAVAGPVRSLSEPMFWAMWDFMPAGPLYDMFLRIDAASVDAHSAVPNTSAQAGTCPGSTSSAVGDEYHDGPGVAYHGSIADNATAFGCEAAREGCGTTLSGPEAMIDNGTLDHSPINCSIGSLRVPKLFLIMLHRRSIISCFPGVAWLVLLILMATSLTRLETPTVAMRVIRRFLLRRFIISVLFECITVAHSLCMFPVALLVGWLGWTSLVREFVSCYAVLPVLCNLAEMVDSIAIACDGEFLPPREVRLPFEMGQVEELQFQINDGGGGGLGWTNSGINQCIAYVMPLLNTV